MHRSSTVCAAFGHALRGASPVFTHCPRRANGAYGVGTSCHCAASNAPGEGSGTIRLDIAHLARAA
ncbi:hypothetical protein WT67_23780 [Burkholderia stagnalis]|uniref:Uncharacterized protein n=1 Tax=Burkholderia stagnalis TaxID=1503054 RepID=A0A6L3N212_9BURK|nr:hypothetical protein [Burkholderia stagnalis]AOK56629.1 hypothetical protein WT74_28590 [Burkholderia stagnalis]KAB0639739.1 hypothetical protein F7R25_07215 [Burkholderia stagnalis]KVN32420.1 hypothetical protein WT11_18280 [Burkholderia stagnalis]KVN62349.1 hypothetical protein WT14_14615 [Burkholderia stagnalis]KVO40980.1 hypothetical protein WT17_17675 [Burkholderia stagnalis]